jgi:hypothetical protein
LVDAVSDNVLSVIPTDPRWRPEPPLAERVRVIVEGLLPDLDGITEVKLTWHQRVAVVDCGANLQRITCPHCTAEIDTNWWGDLIEDRYEMGFDDLTADLPCCGRTASLTDLGYDWPCGFARFEIEIWNPERGWFSTDELTAVAKAIGHPVRQIMAHI